jgi:hypothetical protein
MSVNAGPSVQRIGATMLARALRASPTPSAYITPVSGVTTAMKDVGRIQGS